MEGEGEKSEQLIDIGIEESDTVTPTVSEVESLRAELKKTKDKLDNALSEVAVAQVLQENLCSVERQKVYIIMYFGY